MQAKFEAVRSKWSRVMTPQSEAETSDWRVRKTIMSQARRPPAVAPSHFKSPTAASRRPRRSYPSYHVLWPPAIVQIFFRKSILASCGGCPRRNGMHVTPEDFTSRGACLCMRLLAFMRMPIESASLNTRSTSFRDLIRLLSCRPRWAGKLEQSQTLIPGGAGAAAAR